MGKYRQPIIVILAQNVGSGHLDMVFDLLHMLGQCLAPQKNKRPQTCCALQWPIPSSTCQEWATALHGWTEAPASRAASLCHCALTSPNDCWAQLGKLHLSNSQHLTNHQSCTGWKVWVLCKLWPRNTIASIQADQWQTILWSTELASYYLACPWWLDMFKHNIFVQVDKGLLIE